MIEEAGKLLSESNGIVRGLDPDGRLQSKAKQKASSHEATPEEYHLAECLKELSGTVAQTIENAKKKLEGMPHAKKGLNPLWGLMGEPLMQLLAGVGLLLSGVLGIVGKLVSLTAGLASCVRSADGTHSSAAWGSVALSTDCWAGSASSRSLTSSDWAARRAAAKRAACLVASFKGIADGTVGWGIM